MRLPYQTVAVKPDHSGRVAAVLGSFQKVADLYWTTAQLPPAVRLDKQHVLSPKLFVGYLLVGLLRDREKPWEVTQPRLAADPGR